MIRRPVLSRVAGIFFTTSICFVLSASALHAQAGIAKTYHHAVVVSANSDASHAGVEVIRQGGNAVDAAVAVGFALAVTYPEAGNIGGGGFMVVRMSNGETNTLDFREVAPFGASRTMYQNKDGDVVKGLSREGYLAVGVPGTVDGLVRAHAKYGKLPLKTDMEPAIELARKGYQLSYDQARVLNYYRDKFLHYASSSKYFVKPDSTLWKEGELFKQEDLAKTLELIAEKGRDGFYTGKTADLIVQQMKDGHGLITHEDLAKYHSIWRKPITADYKNYQLIMMPPPSSGGIVIKQILKMVEPYGVDSLSYNGSRYIHLMSEAERRAYADRAYFLGDPDFVKMPLSYITSDKYLKKRMSNFSWTHATRSKDVDHGKVPGFSFKEHKETTHFSIVDPDGNAVSITYTLNGGFGSHVSVAGAGFVLNNEMDDFSAKPGVPNMYGLLGGEANAIQPDKRMLSSMTPTIVTQNGKLRMVLGSPGGSTIITTVLQTFFDMSVFHMNAQQAVSAPRFHMQWYPDQINSEPYAIHKDAADALLKMGHHLHQWGYWGRANCVFIKANGDREAGADPRGEDDAFGY